VETILVAGVDGVVGANLVASLSGRQPAIGVAFQNNVRLHGCDLEFCGDFAPDSIARIVERVAPQRIVYCGPGAQSCWEASTALSEKELERAAAWLAAAEARGAHWTLISSDGVFTGPWMFHAENSQSWCTSPEAAILRRMEEQTSSRRPEALIVRTHAYGWSSATETGAPGWLEQLLEGIEHGDVAPLDAVRHASPILATDLVDVVQRAWHSGLAGVYHIAGAERVNPIQFARRLAHEFGLTFLHSGGSESLTDRAVGFGRGETSLQTRKVRRALGIGLPMLGEGLQRLYQQHLDGYRNHFRSHEQPARNRVA
jgi:dTDP-4-dehydrorhamnose reductase